ncbi:phage tail protein [Erwinia endophytica]|uniref:tail protein X n=1 Tax=Erwinia endophytica TaxID=1563158 RepID=UPI001265FD2E|nr:tail protein X [Erwinia endophytica]KAB8307266.1 phage tail protein [Erwinia endophytica]
MATIYQTRDGDVLDAICADHYGTDNLAANVLTVLDANSGLADRGAVYPAGVQITLPDIVTTVATSSNSLWD